MRRMKLLLIVSCICYYLGQSHASEQDSNPRDAAYSVRSAVQYSSFACPYPFGTFPDPDDCSNFYTCVMNKAIHFKCPTGKKFDIFRRKCVTGIFAICGHKDKSTTVSPTQTTPGMFFCPSFGGMHPHPQDCSKYYKCTFFVASEKSCPENQLFDAIKRSCKPANEVNCGDRKRPGQTTVDNLTDQPSTHITDTPTIPEELTTPDKIPPPETDCDEDDVDCMIDEMGDPDRWFRCPEDIGSYPHPSSDKLFIFCMNWIPSVKKCGMHMVFSKEKMTCIDP